MRLAALAALLFLPSVSSSQPLLSRPTLPSPLSPSAVIAPRVLAPSLSFPTLSATLLLPKFTPPASVSLGAPTLPALPVVATSLGAAALPAVTAMSAISASVSNSVKPASLDSDYVGSQAVFDGGTPRPAGPTAPSLPSYLSIADPADAVWVARVVAAAQDSATARRVLHQVAALVASRSRPVPLELGRTRLGGEFDYDTEVVRLSRSHRKAAPIEAVPVLVHELRHVVQKELGVPSDAFEMELESYMNDFKIGMELDLGPATRPWDRKVERRFRGDLDRFMAWLLKEYKDNRGLVTLGLREYRARLSADAASARRRVASAERGLAQRAAALERLRREGAPEAVLENFAAAELAPLRERARLARIALAWAERDLGVLDDPRALRNYRAYSRRVMDLVRRTHAAYSRLISPG